MEVYVNKAFNTSDLQSKSIYITKQICIGDNFEKKLNAWFSVLWLLKGVKELFLPLCQANK